MGVLLVRQLENRLKGVSNICSINKREITASNYLEGCKQ